MELKLNIYEGKTIVKTYTSDDFMLMTGTCEDILKLIDIDKLDGDLNDDKAMMEIVKIVVKAFNSFGPMMKDVFDGLTDEEYRRTSILEVAGVVLNIIKFTFGELFKASSKN